jgi:hypothetical protein
MTTAETNLLLFNPFIATKTFISLYGEANSSFLEMYIDTAKKVL